MELYWALILENLKCLLPLDNIQAKQKIARAKQPFSLNKF